MVDEMQSQISDLQDENEQLRQRVHDWKQKCEAATSSSSKCQKCQHLQLRIDANVETTEAAIKAADDLRQEVAEVSVKSLQRGPFAVSSDSSHPVSCSFGTSSSMLKKTTSRSRTSLQTPNGKSPASPKLQSKPRAV